LTLLKGYRERLHGHNYRVDLKIWGDRGHDGYVVDFGKMKAVIRQLCKEINEHVIIPVKSDVLLIEEEGDNITIKTEDNSFFRYGKWYLNVDYSDYEGLVFHNRTANYCRLFILLLKS